MKRATAVRHLHEMVEDCALLVDRMAGIGNGVRVVGLWAYGAVLEPDAEWGDDRQFARAAVALAVREDAVPWLAPGRSVGWVASMVRWDKRPVALVWRSADAPVWNHRVLRPLLLWDAAGPREQALAALANGHDLDALRDPAPTDDQLRARLERELAVSLNAVRRADEVYEAKRWGKANHLALADDLHAATEGYLDLLDALKGTNSPTI